MCFYLNSDRINLQPRCSDTQCSTMDLCLSLLQCCNLLLVETLKDPLCFRVSDQTIPKQLHVVQVSVRLQGHVRGSKDITLFSPNPPDSIHKNTHLT